MLTKRCGGNGLILAGVIVSLVGLGIVLVRTLAVPREYTTLLVGLALLGAGLVRRMLRAGDGT
jgi:hypothetical protein